jgi:hypothetical protein
MLSIRGPGIWREIIRLYSAAVVSRFRALNPLPTSKTAADISG